MANFGDEILIKDRTGRFKILRGGKFYDLEEAVVKPAVALPPLKLVEQILKKSGIVVAENLKIRLAEIFEAYLKDVRDKFETKSALGRAVEVGGMGLSLEQADLVIKLIEKEKLKEIAPLPKPSPAKEEKFEAPLATAPSPAPTPVAAEVSVLPEQKAGPAAPPVLPITPGVAEFVFSPADEQEILAHKEKLPVIIAGFKPIEVAKFINEIIRESGLILDETNRKKLENILLTNLKDIRDGYETRATLLYAPEPAGLGLKEEQIEKILSIARKKLSMLEEQLKKEEEEKTKKAIEEEKQRISLERKKAEEKVKEKIDVRWAEITGRQPEPIEIGTELVSPPLTFQPKAPQLTALTAPSIVKIAEKAPLPEISPLQPIEPIPKIEKKPKGLLPEVLPQEAPKVVPKAPPTPPFILEEKPLEILKPVPRRAEEPVSGKVEVSVFRRPEVPSKRPRLEDVKVKPRLIGPIEELREITLVDFRRLAPTPFEATKKILDKLNLLEKESFKKRIAGIQAWRASEVVKLYLEISREVLIKKKALSQIIAERASLGKPTLTLEEYQAVMELSKALRY